MTELIGKLINYIGSLGPYAQIGTGTASGAIIAFSVMKIGKFAAALVGSAIILIKIAEIENLIDIDWDKMQHNVHNISSNPFKNVTIGYSEDIPSSINNFVVSFIGGSLMGIGCA